MQNVCVCVCVNSEGSREPAHEWTLCMIPRTKMIEEGDTYSVLTFLFYEIAFIESCRGGFRGGSLPSRF